MKKLPHSYVVKLILDWFCTRSGSRETEYKDEFSELVLGFLGLIL